MCNVYSIPIHFNLAFLPMVVLPVLASSNGYSAMQKLFIDKRQFVAKSVSLER